MKNSIDMAMHIRERKGYEEGEVSGRGWSGIKRP